MFDQELEQAVAKIQKSDTPMSKADQYQQLKTFSNRQRLPAESPEGAFTKFITQDPNGKVLYRKYAETKGASVSTAPEPDSDDTGGASEGLQKLRAIAAELRAKDKSLSASASMMKAIQTVEGAKAYLADRQARRVA